MSRTLNFLAALIWATVVTVAGSMVSVLLAQGLVKTFSGQGIIGAELVNDSTLAAVGLTAGLYVVLHRLRVRSGITSQSCLCVGNAKPVLALGRDFTRY